MVEMDTHTRKREGKHARTNQPAAGCRRYPVSANDNLEMEDVAALERHPKKILYVGTFDAT